MIVKVKKKQGNSHDCIICGMDNPNGVKAAFYSMEDNRCAATLRFGRFHQSYPSRTHGGMITALLDEAIGRALWVHDDNLWGVTMKINVEFHAPVPYEEDLICVSEITKRTKMFFDGVAELYDKNEKLLARAYATYIIIPLEKAAQEDNIHPSDVNVMVDDDVKELDLPELKATRKLD